ncbi:MAG TPA: ShlB/FhaC/HecB family hemolysin secretion/activation protein [Burkholderiales bacterium]|nr:ShlB/FhaC/HecB family hemolysin secretion/activation protein [Burkholderiales bacterium]
MGSVAAQVRPDAGRIQEQLRIPEPPRPAQPPQIRIEPPLPEGKGDTPPFYVDRFRVSGATAISSATLLGLLGEPKRRLTLAEVQAIADRITKHYQDHGYIVARALIPAQEVRDGVVDVVVLEGRYGRIDIHNSSDITESRLRGLLGGVREYALVHGPSLERAVLLISDLAGVQPKATLEPGESTGLTNLVLEVAPTRNYEFDATLDNLGSSFTGRYRLTAGLAWNSPFGIGDRFAARALVSDKDLFALRLAYEAPLGASGLRGTVHASHTAYELGDAFASLEQKGTASAAGAFALYPLIRSSQRNLRLQLGAERRELEDRIGAFDLVNKKTMGVVQWGAGGDLRDDTLAGAVTGFQILATHGELDLRTRTLEESDAATARTEGRYSKLALSASRLQALTSRLRASIIYTGQLAFDNLDSSEKLSVGGLAGVRAYPLGEAPGDDAHVLQAELRYHTLAVFGGHLVPMVFADWAQSRINHEVWPGFTGSNKRRLSGYGLGAETAFAGSTFVRGWYARKRGNEPATADVDRKDRLWLQAGALF